MKTRKSALSVNESRTNTINGRMWWTGPGGLGWKAGGDGRDDIDNRSWTVYFWTFPDVIKGEVITQLILEFMNDWTKKKHDAIDHTYPIGLVVERKRLGSGLRTKC